MESVGKSMKRVDARGKVTGEARYANDLKPKNCLTAKVVHATIANGRVLSIDTSEAEKVPGVVKIVTCFDVPDIEFPTAGHPWSVEPAHQDIADRKLLNERVRLYGDDIAVRERRRSIRISDRTMSFFIHRSVPESLHMRRRRRKPQRSTGRTSFLSIPRSIRLPASRTAILSPRPAGLMWTRTGK